MKNSLFLLTCASLLACPLVSASILPSMGKKQSAKINRLPVNWSASSVEKEKAAVAWKKISAWLKDAPEHGRSLHLVYVTLEDRPPLPDHLGRTRRIAENIQAYYADQMKENGFPPLTFDLVKDEKGQSVVHEVHMKGKMADYDYHSSGQASFKAAQEELAKKGIDLEKEYALIVVQMPDKKGPYYGGGNYKSGRGWVCDAEYLDTPHFASKEEGEQFYFGKKGKANTIYIGGTAHELGHAFGLPHTKTPQPRKIKGASLMGDGNYSYGEELRGEGKGAYFIETDALRLASLPLFVGKSRLDDGTLVGKFSDFSLEKDPKGDVILKGKVMGSPPIYGVVAYIDPAGGDDYDATAYSALVADDGHFVLPIERKDMQGLGEVRLVALHVNGATTTRRARLSADKGKLDFSALVLGEAFDSVHDLWNKGDRAATIKAFDALKAQYEKDPLYDSYLKAWELCLRPVLPQKTLESVAPEQKEVSLAEIKPTQVSSGWGPAYWNALPSNPYGPVLYFEEQKPSDFIYTHAQGHFSYSLDKMWKKFTGIVGCPVGLHGKVRIEILVDGKKVFESPVLTNGKSVPFDVSVDGANSLEIKVNKENAQTPDNGCWGIVAEPLLSR